MGTIVAAIRRIGSWIGIPLFIIGVIAVLGDGSSLLLCALRPSLRSSQHWHEFWSNLPVDFVLLIGGLQMILWQARGTRTPSSPATTPIPLRFAVRNQIRGAFWATIAILVLYPMSTGPMAWLFWNIRLPGWAVVGIHDFYLPLKWLGLKSEAYVAGLNWYATCWFDVTKPQATPPMAFPYGDTPPILSALSGILISAWLIWNLVRWVNRRDMTRIGIHPTATRDPGSVSH